MMPGFMLVTSWNGIHVLCSMQMKLSGNGALQVVAIAHSVWRFKVNIMPCFCCLNYFCDLSGFRI